MTIVLSVDAFFRSVDRGNTNGDTKMAGNKQREKWDIMKCRPGKVYIL